MKRFTISLIALFLLGSCAQNNNQQQNTTTPVTDSTSVEDYGKQLFSINCGSCHMVKQDLTGPALAGVQERWPDKKLLYRYIKNSQEVIKENKYAMDLYMKWNRTMMTPFPNLSEADITAILKYIEVNGHPAP